jgi:glutamine synthetase
VLFRSGFDDLRTATMHASHDLVIYQAAQADFYGAVADMCDKLGVRLAKMHEEIGGGFMEACIRAAPALSAADQAVLFRNFVRVLAMGRGQTVSFMPRWSEEADSQSSHIHVSLRDPAGNPAFWDPAAPHNMSDTFRHFLGGLQRFLPEVMLIFAPTVNSWRRFAEGTFAPPAFTWGIEMHKASKPMTPARHRK